MILVHVDEDINMPRGAENSSGSSKAGGLHARPGAISSGWVVMRSLNQVHVSSNKVIVSIFIYYFLH